MGRILLGVCCCMFAAMAPNAFSSPRGAVMKKNKSIAINAFTPEYHKGDAWKVEYVLSLPSPRPDPEPSQVSEIWNYEVMGEEMRGLQPVYKIKISTRNLPFHYWLYLAKPQATVYAIEYVEGDKKWEEDNNGGLIDAFLRFATDERLLFDWAYFSNQKGNGVREIRPLRNWPFTQEITFDRRYQTMHVRIAGNMNGEDLVSVQTWNTQQPWWTAASKSLGGRTVISGRLLSSKKAE